MEFNPLADWQYSKDIEAQAVVLGLLARIVSGQQQSCDTQATNVLHISGEECDEQRFDHSSQSSQSSQYLLKQTLLLRLAQLFAYFDNPCFVSCAALGNYACSATVYVTRNSGFQKRDMDFCAALNSSIARINHQYTKKKSRELLELLLAYYAPGIRQAINILRGHYCSIQQIISPCEFKRNATLRELCAFLRSCDTFNKKSSVDLDFAKQICRQAETLSESEMVLYSLRVCTGPRIASEIQRRLCFIGQIRAIHKTILESARSLPRLEYFDVDLVPLAQLQDQPSRLVFNKAMRMAEQQLGRSFKAREISILRSEYGKQLIMHAEMQMIFFLSKVETADIALFPYLGISMGPCYMCSLFLEQYGRFTTRPGHGRIHPHWTLPWSLVVPKEVANSLSQCSSNVILRLSELIRNASQHRGHPTMQYSTLRSDNSQVPGALGKENEPTKKPLGTGRKSGCRGKSKR